MGGRAAVTEIGISKYSKDDSDPSIRLNLKLKNWNRRQSENEKPIPPDA